MKNKIKGRHKSRPSNETFQKIKKRKSKDYEPRKKIKIRVTNHFKD